MAGPSIAGALGVAGGLLDLGRVALEKVAPADPEERRKWSGGKAIGRLAGLVAFLDVRIPDLEGRGKSAARLRAARARAAAELAELRRTVDAIDGWRVVALEFRETLRDLNASGAKIVFPSGETVDVGKAFRRALASLALRLRDEDDDTKAAVGGEGGSGA